MRPVPFVASVAPEEAEKWRAALQTAMPDFRIEPPDALTPAERTAAEVTIVANPDPAELARLPGVRWVQSLWAGVERMLPSVAVDLPIVRMIDPALSDVMAEAVLAWTLYLHRDMPRYLRQQAERRWRQHELPLARERRVGVLGLGHLGGAAARRLRDNGFSVHGWSRRPKTVEGVATRDGACGLSPTLAESDVVVVLLPLTTETRGLLNEQRLRLLPDGASIINFGRGPVVDESALLSALDAGRLSHAVLDVFASEPLPAEHRFWAHPAVTVLPHVAAPTSRASACRLVKANLERYFDTGEIPAAVSRAQGY